MRDKSEAMKTILKVNGMATEEQAQQITNLTIQNQCLKTKSDALTKQIIILKDVIQTFQNYATATQTQASRMQTYTLTGGSKFQSSIS